MQTCVKICGCYNNHVNLHCVDIIFCPALNFDKSFSHKLKDFIVLMVEPHLFIYFLLLSFFYVID